MMSICLTIHFFLISDMWLHFVKKTSGEVETLGVMIRAQLGNLTNLP